MSISPDRIITAHTLRHLLSCERRAWLDVYGDPTLRGETPPDVQRLYALGVQHELRVQAATAATITPFDVASWEEGVSTTRDLMRQGVQAIAGAYLEVETPLDLSDRVYTLRGRVDRLVRVEPGEQPLYALVEIKQHNRADEADRVQLDFYVWLLSQLQGDVPPAELWLGADAYGEPRFREPHLYDEEGLLSLLTRAAERLATLEEPPVHLIPDCKTCPWDRLCRSQAEFSGSLDLLYRVSRKTRAAMRQAGYTSLAHVAAQTPDDLQQVKGIGPATAPAIRANAQSWIGRRPVWYGQLPAGFGAEGWMFDLETWESRGETVPWCMGWCDTQGHTQIALVAPVQSPEALILPDGQAVILVPDSDGAWEVFAEAVGGDAPVFHWTAYDAGMLRATGPRAVQERLGARMHDLHRTVTRAVSFPLGSTSIKTVSAYLGFPWPGYQDWFAAYQDYRYWLDDGRLDALMRACMYQRADVESMAWVWRWLIASAPAESRSD